MRNQNLQTSFRSPFYDPYQRQQEDINSILARSRLQAKIQNLSSSPYQNMPTTYQSIPSPIRNVSPITLSPNVPRHAPTYSYSSKSPLRQDSYISTQKKSPIVPEYFKNKYNNIETKQQQPILMQILQPNLPKIPQQINEFLKSTTVKEFQDFISQQIYKHIILNNNCYKPESKNLYVSEYLLNNAKIHEKDREDINLKKSVCVMLNHYLQFLISVIEYLGNQIGEFNSNDFMSTNPTQYDTKSTPQKVDDQQQTFNYFTNKQLQSNKYHEQEQNIPKNQNLRLKTETTESYKPFNNSDALFMSENNWGSEQKYSMETSKPVNNNEVNYMSSIQKPEQRFSIETNKPNLINTNSSKYNFLDQKNDFTVKNSSPKIVPLSGKQNPNPLTFSSSLQQKANKVKKPEIAQLNISETQNPTFEGKKQHLEESARITSASFLNQIYESAIGVADMAIKSQRHKEAEEEQLRMVLGQSNQSFGNEYDSFVNNRNLKKIDSEQKRKICISSDEDE